MLPIKLSSTSEDVATPTSPDHTSGDEEGEGEEEEREREGEEEGSILSGSEGEGKDSDQSDEGTEHTSHSHTITTPAKRGTEIRLSGLVMGEGVGVVIIKCALGSYHAYFQRNNHACAVEH